MKKFDKPQLLVGEQLIAELNDAGVFFDNVIFDKSDGFIYLNIEENDYDITKEIIKNHKAENLEAKHILKKNQILQRLGISEEEAKVLLG